jgi:VanZ family protein
MKIAPDKWKHFFVGIAMGAALQFFFLLLLSSKPLSISLALFFSIAIGYGFEVYSKITRRGHYEVLDAVAAVIGAVLGIAIILLALLF